MVKQKNIIQEEDYYLRENIKMEKNGMEKYIMIEEVKQNLK